MLQRICLLLTQSIHDDCNAKCPFMIQGQARPVSRSYGRYAACFTFASKRARALFPSLAATAMLSKKTGELSSGPPDRRGKSPTSMALAGCLATSRRPNSRLGQIPHNACGINGVGRLKFQREAWKRTSLFISAGNLVQKN